MSDATIAAVIPVSDKAPHVGAAIQSVLAQRRAPDEILIVDDASRDGSREIIEGLRDDRIRLFTRPEPGPGGYAARNLAVREARSEWIAFLDADDLWYPDHVETLAGLISKAAPDVIGAFSGWEWTWADGRRRRDLFGAWLERSAPETVLDFDGFLSAWVTLGASPIFTLASAFRRAALIGAGLFPEHRCHKGGDIDLWLRIMTTGRAVASTRVTAAYQQGTVNQVTRLVPTTLPHCTWPTIDALAADAPAARKRLLEELRAVTVMGDFRLQAAMERFTPTIGERTPRPLQWARRLALEALVRLPVRIQGALRTVQRRLTRIARRAAGRGHR